MLHLDESTHLLEKILDLAPQAVEKVQQMFAKKNSSESNNQSGNQNQQNQSGPKQDLDF